LRKLILEDLVQEVSNRSSNFLLVLTAMTKFKFTDEKSVLEILENKSEENKTSSRSGKEKLTDKVKGTKSTAKSKNKKNKNNSLLDKIKKINQKGKSNSDDEDVDEDDDDNDDETTINKAIKDLYKLEEQFLAENFYKSSTAYENSFDYTVSGVKINKFDYDTDDKKKSAEDTYSEMVETDKEAGDILVKVQYAATGGTLSEVDFISRRKLSHWATFNPGLMRMYEQLFGITRDVNYGFYN